MCGEGFNRELLTRWELPETTGASDLVAELAVRVAWLMKHDYERLLNAVYLLDVPERRFRDAMGTGSTEASARAMAKLILEREQEKFESRRRYRREQSTDVSAQEVDEGKLPEG